MHINRMTVFENRVLWSFGPKRNKVTGKQRRPYNEELYDLYSSSNTFLLVKSRKMKWKGMWHVWETGEVCTEF